MLNKNFQRWFSLQKKQNKIRIKIKKLNSLENWHYNKELIFHRSKRFFKIIGIEVKSNLAGENWDQPIIVQNDIIEWVPGIAIRKNNYLADKNLIRIEWHEIRK